MHCRSSHQPALNFASVEPVIAHNVDNSLAKTLDTKVPVVSHSGLILVKFCTLHSDHCMIFYPPPPLSGPIGLTTQRLFVVGQPCDSKPEACRLDQIKALFQKRCANLKLKPFYWVIKHLWETEQLVYLGRCQKKSPLPKLQTPPTQV